MPGSRSSLIVSAVLVLAAVFVGPWGEKPWAKRRPAGPPASRPPVLIPVRESLLPPLPSKSQQGKRPRHHSRQFVNVTGVIKDVFPLAFPTYDSGLLTDVSGESVSALLRFMDSEPKGAVVALPTNLTGGPTCVAALLDEYSDCPSAPHANDANNGSALSSIKVPSHDVTVAMERAGPFGFGVTVLGLTFIGRGMSVMQRRMQDDGSCAYVHVFRLPWELPATLRVMRHRVPSYFELSDPGPDSPRCTSMLCGEDIPVKPRSVALAPCKPTDERLVRPADTPLDDSPPAPSSGERSRCLQPYRVSPQGQEQVPHTWWGNAVKKTVQHIAQRNHIGYHPWTQQRYQLGVEGCQLLRSYLYPERAAAACRQRLTTDGGSTVRYKILFTGDSQSRTLYRHLEAMIFNRKVIILKGQRMSTYRVRMNTTAESIRGGRGPIGHVFDAEYIMDPYLDNLAGRWKEYAEEYDCIVFGFGSWPARFGNWSLERFATRVQSIANAIAGHSGKTPVTVWIGSPARSPEFALWSVPGPNQMNNYRLGMYSTAGAKILGGIANVSWLDMFGASSPATLWHSGDGQHYHRSILLFGLVDWLLSGICERD